MSTQRLKRRVCKEEKKENTNHLLCGKVDLSDNAMADEPTCRRNESRDWTVLVGETLLEVQHCRASIDHALLDVDLGQNLLHLFLCLLQLSCLEVAFFRVFDDFLLIKKNQ